MMRMLGRRPALSAIQIKLAEPGGIGKTTIARLSAAPPPSSLAGNHFADLESLTDSRHVTGMVRRWR
jgi:hypothetical protein